MTQSRKTLSILFSVLLLGLPGLAAAMDTGGLLGMLTGQLGVSEQQASGGTSALMDVAKQNLPGNDYTKLLTGAPDLGSLMGGGGGAAGMAAAALGGGVQSQPQSSGSSWGGMLDSATSLIGGENQTVAQAAKLAQTFDGLGLSPDMVGKFAKVTADYVKGTGGIELSKMLMGALPL